MNCKEPYKTKLPGFIWGALLAILFALIAPHIVYAQMGECSNCHTMHNSQDNLPMRYDTEASPLPQLLRSDCLGCHAMGTTNNIEYRGTARIPQVYHNDTLAGDLAGGNFAYIDGLKGGAASDGKGHNVSIIPGIGTDATHTVGPPGGIRQSLHFGPGAHITTNELTCAGDPANNGRFGCHGNRDTRGDPNYPGGITGAHHENQSGSLDPGPGEARAGYGYRFLVGVKGYEDTDWQLNPTDSDHNEYFALGSPTTLDCSASGCHLLGGVRAPNGTMSEFCATCHGNFHTLSVGAADDSISNSSGVGSGASPFIRHPADLFLPAGGEFDSYTQYKLSAPVGRTTSPVPAPNNSVATGSDAVMCLSCHVAHGSEFPDMLRWSYGQMDIGGGGPGDGEFCFACHTEKD